MKTTLQTLLLTIVTIALSACGGDDGPRELESGETLRVMASTPHLASLAMAVAGDRAEVDLLPGEGSNPHNYEPTVSDRRRLQKVHLLLVNGLELEPWDARELAEAANATLVDCSAGIDKDWLVGHDDEGHDDHDEHDHHDHDHDDHDHDDHDHDAAHDHDEHEHDEHAHHDHGAYNPHVWLSVEGAVSQARAITDAFAKIDTANADAYRKNFDDLKKRLEALRDEYRPKVEKLKKRRFVSNHDAFPYFAREFGLEQAGVIQRTPGHNPSVEERREIEEMLKDERVDAIFMEPGFDDAGSKAIAESSGLPLATLDPFGVGKPAPDALEKILRRNLETVLKTLG